MRPGRAQLESLLRARKLDVTLTTSESGRPPDADRLASTGWALLDDRLGGGLRRGHLSEVIGARSSGRSALVAAITAAAAARGEAVALVDTDDRFDPLTAAAAGVDVRRLLWVRETGNADRALKAMNLILQAGGFGVVVFDLADVRPLALRQFPHTTWMRLSRVIEGSQTIALLVGSEHIARSPGGVTIALESSVDRAGDWIGTSARTRRLRGLTLRPRIVSAIGG
jgi:RecA/RadA recombinase